LELAAVEVTRRVHGLAQGVGEDQPMSQSAANVRSAQPPKGSKDHLTVGLSVCARNAS
jgi:hypothetical protein